MLKKYLLLAILILTKFTLSAQVIQLIMSPNPPTVALDWLKTPPPVKIMIFSIAAGAGPYKVQGVVTKAGKTVMTTNLNNTRAVTLNLGANYYVASDFWNSNSFDVSFSDLNIISGKLKPDQYNICVSLFNANGEQIGASSCANFQITDYQEPTLITPQADAVIPENQLMGSLNFRWSGVTPFYQGTVKYKFEIFEVPENMNALQALTRMPIVNTTRYVNFYNGIYLQQIFNQRKIAGVNSYRYVWRVQSIDGTTNEPIGKNAGSALGYSELRMFTINTTPTVNVVTETPVDKPKITPTVPIQYTEPTLATLKDNEKLEPEAAYEEIQLKWTSIKPRYPSRVRYELKVYQAGSGQSESQALNNIPTISKELSGDTTYSWRRNIYSINDTKFYWRVKAIDDIGRPIGKKSGAALGFSEIGSFTVKAAIPKEAVPVFPQENASISFYELKLGATFKWLGVSPKLSKKNQYILSIYEKQSKKDSLVAQFTLTDSLKNTWKDTLFKKEGTYFWNITSKDSAGNLLGVKTKNKGVSENFSFTMKDSSRVDSVIITDCDGNKKVIKTTVSLSAGNIDFRNRFITINTFKMLVTELSKSTNSNSIYTLSGKGSIMIPWLKTPIHVEFTDISVSGSSNEVTNGNVFALQDETIGDIPKLLKTNGSQKPTKAQAKNLNKRLKDNAPTKMVLSQNMDNNLIKSNSANIPKLPMGLNNIFDYTLAITEMKFSPQANTLVCVAVLPYNKDNLDDVIAFAATDITFDINSPSKAGGKLALIEDFNIVDPTSESYGVTLKAKHQNNLATFIEWDCKGFKQLKATVDVNFPRDWLTPVSETDQEVPDTVKVSGIASVDIAKLNDWVLSLSLNKSEINGVDGSELEVKEVVFDNSDTKNPTGIKFPTGYTGIKDNTFRGFYIKNASFVLPKFYNKSTDTTGISVEVDNFIISKAGVSGKIDVGAKETPIVNLETGTVGDFQASLDKVEITILNKSVTKAQVSGRMVLPISKSTSQSPNTLNYAANWTTTTKGKGAKVQLTITPEGRLNAEMFAGGELNLNSNSLVKMEYIKKLKKNGKDTIKAEVKLNGNISITKTLMDKIPVNFAMGFENLGFDFNNAIAKKFTMKPATFSFASPQKKAAGFPATISGIVISDNPNPVVGYLASAQLELNLELILGSSIKGKTAIKVVGGIKKVNNKYLPELISANIDSIIVDARVAAVDLKGSLVFYSKDPVYGDGFKGDIRANFAKVGTVTAAVQFGNVPQALPSTGTYDYWFAEAKIILRKALPMINPIGLKGGGIGAWHHMSVSDIPKIDSNAIQGPQATEVKSNRCGATFTPNSSVGLGFKVTGVIVNVTNEESFNGDISFTAQFNNTGGINLIQIDGSMFIGAGLNKRDMAMVKGNLSVSYNFTTDIFDLNSRIDLRIPKVGPDLISTANPISIKLFIDGGKRKGNDPTWYLTVGTPDEPNVINFRPGLVPTTIPAKFYLRAGNTLNAKTGFWQSTIDGIRACGGNISNPQFPVNNTVPNGGFDFGIGFIARGEASCGPFYGNYAAGAEVFFALQKSAPGGCVTDKFGYWYANGGIAAFASAEIGFRGLVTVRMAGTGHMTGGGPEPIWLKGGISGQVKLTILFVKLNFNANVPFQYGTPCYPTQAFSLDNADLNDIVRVSVRDYETTYNKTTSNKINNTITTNVTDESPIVISSLFPIKRVFSIEMADANGRTTTENNYRLDVEIKIYNGDGSIFNITAIETQKLRNHQTIGTNGPNTSYAYQPCIMPLNSEESDGAGHESYFRMGDRFNYIIGSNACWNVSEIRNSGNVSTAAGDRYRNHLKVTEPLPENHVGPLPDPYQPNPYLNKSLSIKCIAQLRKNVTLVGSGYSYEDVYFPAQGLPGSKLVKMETEPYRFTTKTQ
ncbi:MAG: hypothetical protein ACOYMA_11170 [Bacteroidia bacterium]